MKVKLYILRGIKNGRHYIGITNNLVRRLEEHSSGKTKGGQIIGEFELIYTEEFSDYRTAREREKFFKSGQGRRWIRDNIERARPA